MFTLCCQTPSRILFYWQVVIFTRSQALPCPGFLLLILQTKESWAGPQCICPVLYVHVKVVVAAVSTTGMVAIESVILCTAGIEWCGLTENSWLMGN